MRPFERLALVAAFLLAVLLFAVIGGNRSSASQEAVRSNPLPVPPVAPPPLPESVEITTIVADRSNVTFAFRPERAEAKVFLAGEFNGWNPVATPMERMGDGFVRATVALADGRYSYKFVVDGKWIADPKNVTQESDGHDGFNSVLVVGDVGSEVPMDQRVVDGFQTPLWARDAIWYQIMLDRFANGEPLNDPPHTRAWTSDWRTTSPRETAGGQTFWEWAVFNRHYGGDLEGLRQRIPYLKSLGVNAIYLNPVFEAPSHHKYDATNFVHIDDNFGSIGDAEMSAANEDLLDATTWGFNESDRLFLAVIRDLKAAGFRIIVDGVFNHVGETHVAFADVRTRGASSPYAGWFEIDSFEPFAYRGWAGFGQLPAFRKSSEGLASETLTEHIMAVTRRWMDPNGDGDPTDGVDGWRLDVPNEVPMGFWRAWRKTVKEINPDAYIVGEIWKRADMWLDGASFDAVMNYQFAQAVVAWASGEIHAGELDKRLAILRLAYPEQASFVMQNLLAGHDTDRLVSMIANPGRGYDRANSEKPGSAYLGTKPSDAAYQRARLAVLVQMTYLGAPMIWYGDEAGMWGSDDPFCRKPMIWADLQANDDPTERIDETHLAAYRALIALRRDSPALRQGGFRTLLADEVRNLWIFVRELGDERVIVAINAGTSVQRVDLPREVWEGWSWSEKFSSADPNRGGPSSPESASIPALGGVVFVGVRAAR
jgi:cyclomaltodextrinase